MSKKRILDEIDEARTSLDVCATVAAAIPLCRFLQGLVDNHRQIMEDGSLSGAPDMQARNHMDDCEEYLDELEAYLFTA